MRYSIVSAILVAIPLLNGCVPLVATGVGTAVVATEDRRTIGTLTEDNGIEFKAANRVHDKFKDPHLNFTSFNRMVLVTGEASDAATKAEIEKITLAVENVRGVYNEVAIAGNSALSARANDAYLTGKVKARFVDQQKFNVVHVKVVTESSVVYLLGMVKRKEAEDATEIARTSGGVQKVVRLFEYLD